MVLKNYVNYYNENQKYYIEFPKQITFLNQYPLKTTFLSIFIAFNILLSHSDIQGTFVTIK